MQLPDGRDWARKEWQPRHPHEQTSAVLVAAAKKLRSGGLQPLQAVGFCYGAVGVLRLSSDGLISSAVVCHPSGFTEDRIALVRIPLLFNCAENDSAFSAELGHRWETALKERTLAARFSVYPGVEHGFVARLDGTVNGLQQRQAASRF